MQPYRFAHEPITEALFKELDPLFKEHYAEIAHYQTIPLNYDLQAYIELEKAGNMKWYVVRDAYNKPVGYCNFFIRKNLHYASSLQAYQDILFLQRDIRGAGLGAELIQWCEMKLKNVGCEVVYHHVKARHNFGPLLERMGYELIDFIYGKKL